MQVSVTISGFTRLFGNDLRAVVEAARVADAAGIHQLVVPDHVVMGTRTDRYPFGKFPYGPEEPWPEPLIVLAAIAGATERVRLATGILISPLRPAVLLAKTAATLDQVSHGRLDLGVGIGWQREEYAAEGIPFADRRSALRRPAARVRRVVDARAAGLVRVVDRVVHRHLVRAPPRAAGWRAAVVRHRGDSGDGRPHGRARSRVAPDPHDHARGVARRHRATARRVPRGGPRPGDIASRETLRPVIDADGRLDGPATRAAAEPLAERGITMASVGLGRNLADAGGVAQFFEDLGHAFAS